MTYDETIQLLTLVKGNWYKQPTDDLTIRMWQAILGTESELQDTWEAVMALIREPADEPPTPGAIYRAQLEYRQRRIQNENLQLKRLGTWKNQGYAPGTCWNGDWIADENGRLRPFTRDEDLDRRGTAIKIKRLAEQLAKEKST